ncbi:uncharacterized protein M6B38_312190 [Iris pallida]|uniref:J domain-containing protein n=1 Tax=Iris pallida TaxID=29817 RepID=A0AAX6HGZ5_IRIPA|nr:uncharacterized protein M6B38_215660 [Iris pallida]KAJ6840002.1 uncharacterized protein M6B38_312190 [Iris pallida]
MVDIGLWRQGWSWARSRKEAFGVGARSGEKFGFLVDLDWPMVSRGCAALGRLLLTLLAYWRDCTFEGVRSLAGLGSAAVFVVAWSGFLSLASTSCLVYVLLSLGAAGAAIHFLGSTPGLFIVGSFGILVMWIYGNFWIAGLLLIAGGYMFSLDHARLLIFISTTYAVYYVYTHVGLLGLFLSLNLSFISNDHLNKLLQGYDGGAAGANEGTHFEEQKESEPVSEDFPEDTEFSPPTKEAEDVASCQSSCKTSVTSTVSNVQKDASCSKVVKAESTSVDEMKRIMISSNHYEALGFTRHNNIDPIILRKEYRRMAVLVHPDKNMGNSLASESFKKLQCAYEASSFGFNKEK